MKTPRALMWVLPPARGDPPRGPADALDGPSTFTPEKLRHVASGLRLEYVQGRDEGPQGVLILGHRVNAHARTSPALALLPGNEQGPGYAPTFGWEECPHGLLSLY